jgi:putative copper resistance protein D
MSLDAALAGCRLVHYAALMLIFGTSALLCQLDASSLRSRVNARMAQALRIAAALVVFSTAVDLPLQTGEIGGAWQSALDFHLLATVLQTDIGHVWCARMLLALVTLLAIWLRQPGRSGGVAIASGLLLASLALTGHAAMDDGPRGVLHGVNHAVHLICAGAWLGSLIPFLLCLRALPDTAMRADATIALRRFSSTGHFAVAGVIVSGMVNTALIVGRWTPDWSSNYQMLLALKVLLTAVMIGLAIANRYVFVPRMRNDPKAASAAIRRRTWLGILLGLAVLALVSALGMLEPTTSP